MVYAKGVVGLDKSWPGIVVTMAMFLGETRSSNRGTTAGVKPRSCRNVTRSATTRPSIAPCIHTWSACGRKMILHEANIDRLVLHIGLYFIVKVYIGQHEYCTWLILKIIFRHLQ